MLLERFQILNGVRERLRTRGIESTIEQETICIGRQQWDRYSRQFMMMLSAAPYIQYRDKSFYIYVTEQYDDLNSLRKYSIKLCDQNKKQLLAYDLDTKHGPHIHEFVDGRKLIGHPPFSGEMEDIVNDMLNRMCEY